jgi:hypothetical protein
MSITKEALIALRNRTLGEYIHGRTSEKAYRADLGAIAVELDRVVSPAGEGRLEDRAARVVAEILAASRARRADEAPARAARLEFWRRRRSERLRREDPAGYEAEIREEAALDAAEPDEIRMARPIVAALGDESIARSARDRVQAIAKRPLAEAPPAPIPVVWTDDDRLTWEEFIGGVPCQGCGHAFLGDDTSQRDGESWSAYRVRMEPIEAEFKSSHPDHGTRWRLVAVRSIAGAAVRRIHSRLNRSDGSV